MAPAQENSELYQIHPNSPTSKLFLELSLNGEDNASEHLQAQLHTRLLDGHAMRGVMLTLHILHYMISVGQPRKWQSPLLISPY